MYAASKAAIETLTRQWSLELAPIRVNAVGPGMVITEGTASNYEGKALELRSNAVPLKRVGDTSDIAQVVSFLASPKSRYITGQVIFVDGGVTAGAPGHNYITAKYPHEIAATTPKNNVVFKPLLNTP